MPARARLFPACLATVLFACALGWQAPVAAETASAQQLRYGYAILYETAGKLNTIDKTLLVKIESDPVDAMTDRVSDAAAKLNEHLEAMADQRKGLSLDETGLPLADSKRRDGTKTDLAKRLLTTSGVDFERTLLLSQLNLINQTRHLAEALAGMESDPEDAESMRKTQKRFDTLYEDVGKMLERDFFCSKNQEQQD